MAVYFKFKSARDYDSVPVVGAFISVAKLKDEIFVKKQLWKGTDFDLVVSHATTNEEFDDTFKIPQNTSVLIRRIPGIPRKAIVVEPEKYRLKIAEERVMDITPPTSCILMHDLSMTTKPKETESDDFGDDPLAGPKLVPIQQIIPVAETTPSKDDEDLKIKALVENSALEWNRQILNDSGAGRGLGRGMSGNLMGHGRGGLEWKTPPAGYICHRCKVPGHFIQHCPTNGDPNYDIKRLRPPTGIPKSMLAATSDGSYVLPNGAVGVMKSNEVTFEKAMECIPSTRCVTDVPPELRCPLCKEVMKDAVLTRKCCFRSFCDKCIRDYIIKESKCTCGVIDILTDDVVPYYALRETISRTLESTTSSSENLGSSTQSRGMGSTVTNSADSAGDSKQHPSKDIKGVLIKHTLESTTSTIENPGSLTQGPDTESAPTGSVACVGEAKQPPQDMESLDTREREVEDVVARPMENKDVKNTDTCEATPESRGDKGIISAKNDLMSEENLEKMPAGIQEKKKKKKVSGTDIQRSPYQDFGAENFYGMPLGYPGFSYYPGGMQMGGYGYAPPYNAAVPYDGSTTGPFAVPFRGYLPPDPFYGQGPLKPGFPQRAPIKSREKCESNKSNLRRKQETERLGERRVCSSDRQRETSSDGNDPLVEAKPKLMSQVATPERSDKSDSRKRKPEMRTERRSMTPARGRYVDDESSEEECHFKRRRPSRREVEEREDSRRSREREHCHGRAYVRSR